MIGDLKLSDLLPKDQWDKTAVPQRVINCNTFGIDGRSASKAWEDLTIEEALLLNGKLRHPRMSGDPFMTPDDIARARANRESQEIRYPDGMEETDESKANERAFRLVVKRLNRPAPVAKQTPVWDPVNMKMVYR